MRATIALAACFLISSSVFAGDLQPNTSTAKMKPVVVQVAKATAAETPMAEGSLEKFGATGLPQ